MLRRLLGYAPVIDEFYKAQQISIVLCDFVLQASQDRCTGRKSKLKKVLYFACVSGSLLLNVRKRIKKTMSYLSMPPSSMKMENARTPWAKTI